ncbi:MAG: TonB-dependent siderophore receptor [Devosia sp.]|uniref:TonB-dependent receptor n=1 Tax=Devosia sp. TaxID=1871048 RepID=UPI003398BD67
MLAFAGVSVFALLSATASAQQTTTVVAPAGSTQLDRLVVVRGPSPISSTGTIGQPAPVFVGRQIAAGTTLGALGIRSVQETPFSITGYTNALIETQQAQTVGDVVLNDPSVRNDASPFSERDAFFIRGFSVTNLDTAYDGLFYLANPRRSFLEGIERVEILKGPSAFVNGGVGRIGGTINLIPKRAGVDPLTKVTASYNSNSQFMTHLDFGRRFGVNNELGVRFNGSYRNGNTAYDHNIAEVGVVALGLDYQGERVRASLDINHATQNIDAPTSLFNSAAAGIAIPAAPNGSINMSSPFEYHDSTHNMVAGRVEFDVLPTTTIYAAGGVSRYREDFVSSSHQIVNANGNARSTLAIQPQQIQGFTGEVGVRTEFDTGPVGHQVSVSYSQSLNENYRGGFAPASIILPATYLNNIYAPVFLANGSVNTSAFPRSDNLPLFASLLSTSFAVSDTLSFADDRFLLTLGGRYQAMKSESFNTRPDRGALGVRNYLYEDGRFSPAIAAAFNVTDAFTVYGNYVEALTEGPTAPLTATNSGQIFAPVVNTQREVGFKYDTGAMLLTAALFDIQQPNGYAAPGGAFDLNGLQVNRGLELTASGEPIEGLRLLGGVTLMDARLAKTAGGTLDGKLVPGVPSFALSLYGEYDLPFIAPGLSVNGRMIYTGTTFYDQANTQQVADWTRFDVGMSYETDGPNGKPMELKAAIENVFDSSYWASSARTYLSAGAPRTFKVSASMEF